MKKFLRIRSMSAVFAASAIILATSSCSNLTDGYSTDPVNITDPSVIQVSKYLTGVEVSLIGVFEGDVARISGLWSNTFSGDDRQYIGLANYSVSGQDFDQEWSTIYTSIFENTKLIRENAKPQNNYVTIGIAQIIDGMSLGLAADLWGDVPYSEARNFSVNPTPHLDAQSAVYASAQALLDSGIVNLAGAGNATGDFLYNGDKTLWARVAHTVKARLYLHTKNYANAITQAGLGLAGPDENLLAPHGDVYGQTFNLYYSFTTYDRTGYMNANSYLPTLLDGSRNNAKTNEEARLWYHFYPGGGLNVNVGSADYELNVLVDFDWGVPSEYNAFFGATTSFPIATWEENQLILAESYMKIGTPDPTSALAALNSVRAYYNTGAHVNSGYAYDFGYQYDDYLYTDFEAGDIENSDNIDQNLALLREILEERYVTLIGQIESWTDMRRTHNFLDIPLPAGKTDFPKRFYYSQAEVNTNPNIPKDIDLYEDLPSFAGTY